MKTVQKNSYAALLGLLVVTATVLPALAGKPLFPVAPTTVKVMVQGPWHATYLDVYFDQVPAGYVLESGGPYYGWCADLNHRISTGVWYTATLDEPATSPWPQIAWVINNWGGHDKYFIQAVIWRLKGFNWGSLNTQIDYWIPGGHAVDHSDVDAYVATANGHSGFVPGPGQYHAVRITVSPDVQLIFFELLQPRDGVPEFGDSIPMVASVAGVFVLLIRKFSAKRRYSN